jgi:hypothetical protein
LSTPTVYVNPVSLKPTCVCVYSSLIFNLISSIHLTFLRLTSTSEQAPIHRSRYILPFIFARPDLILFASHHSSQRHFKVLIQFRPIFNLFRIHTQVSRSCNTFHLTSSQEDYCITGAIDPLQNAEHVNYSARATPKPRRVASISSQETKKKSR